MPTLGVVTFLLLILMVPSLYVTSGEGQSNSPVGAKRVPTGSDPLRALLARSGSVGSIQIALHNTMGTATGTYQQLVRIHSSSYSSLINSNWTNGLPYYTANRTPVYGWLEANASNASADTLLWLRVASLPPYGWTNVSIGFGPKSWFNLSRTGYMGEAPGLSSTYGKFDNGAKVFNFYDNFAGSTLGPWWSGSTAWTTSVTNGFTVGSVPGNGDAIVSSTAYAYPAVVDFYGDLYQTSAATVYIDEGLGTSICSACSNVSNVGWFAPSGSSSGPSPAAASGANKIGGSSVFSTQQYAVFSTEVASTSSAMFQVNYSGTQTLAAYIPNGPLPIALALGSYYPGALTNTSTTYWIRERTYTAQVPATQIIQVLEYPVTVTESGLPTGVGWWINVTGGVSTFSTTTTLSFMEPNGTYSYSVGTSDKSYAAVGSTFRVYGSATPLTVTFSREDFALTFTESGLPSGTNWSVTVNGIRQASTSQTILFAEPNGSYPFSIVHVWGYAASPSSGSLNVRGAGQTLGITMTNRGWIVGSMRLHNANLLLDGQPQPVHNGTFNLSVVASSPTGEYMTYSLVARANGYCDLSKRVKVTPGNVSTADFALPTTPPAPWHLCPETPAFWVTFSEMGLPSSMNWSVTFDNLTESLNPGGICAPPRPDCAVLAFKVPNGTYSFTVDPPSGYSATPGDGAITVSGLNASKVIIFKSAAPKFLGLPAVEGYAALGGIISAVIVAVAAVILLRKRREKSSTGAAESASSPGADVPSAPSGPPST